MLEFISISFWELKSVLSCVCKGRSSKAHVSQRTSVTKSGLAFAYSLSTRLYKKRWHVFANHMRVNATQKQNIKSRNFYSIITVVGCLASLHMHVIYDFFCTLDLHPLHHLLGDIVAIWCFAVKRRMSLSLSSTWNDVVISLIQSVSIIVFYM